MRGVIEVKITIKNLKNAEVLILVTNLINIAFCEKGR